MQILLRMRIKDSHSLLQEYRKDQTFLLRPQGKAEQRILHSLADGFQALVMEEGCSGARFELDADTSLWKEFQN